MATYDEDQVTMSRVLTRPVTGGAKAGWVSVTAGSQDIVAGRLRTELS